MSQLSLLLEAAPELRRQSLLLEAIDGFAEATPSAKLRELIRDLGLLQPVLVVPGPSGRYQLVEGRRRCKAIAQLAAEDQWPAPPHVEALVVNGRESLAREMRGGLALALHATRSPSPASELEAIEAILSAAGTDGEAATVKEIAAQTGMSVQTVRRRLRLRSLTPALRAALDQGRITAGVAEAAARLPEPDQDALASQLAEAGRLTLPGVSEMTRRRNEEARAELPGELFGERERAWQTTVRGHLVAALQAIPSGEEHTGLARLVADALTRAEQL